MSDANVLDPQTTQAPATSGAPQAAPATSTANSQAPATGAPQEGMVPSYRLREIRAQLEQAYNQRLEQERNSWTQERENLDKRIRALAGVDPNPPSRAEAIRNEFFQLFPEYQELSQFAPEIKTLKEEIAAFKAQNQHYWQSYSGNQLDRLYKLASESYDGQLTDAQKAALTRTFIGYVNSDPEMRQRFESDPAIVDEYWKDIASNFVEPARRNAVVSGTARIAQNLPKDDPSGGLVTSTPAKPKDKDERMALAWQAFEAAKSGRG